MLTALGGFSHLFDVKIIPYQIAERRENADPAVERWKLEDGAGSCSDDKLRNDS